MSDELSPGDLARIIKSLDGIAVGKIVQCTEVVGTHSLYGTIWRVSSKETLVTEFGSVGNVADVPAKWMRKIKPGELDKTDEKLLDKILEKAANLGW